MDEFEFHLGRLKAPDFPTRRQSAELLGVFGDPRAVKPLLQMLGDDYWQVRNTVVDALLKIRDRSTISPLIECLRDEDPQVRNTAMSVLNEMGEDVAVPLAHLLAADPSEDVRIFSANTLGRLRTQEAVPGLVAGLKDADENVRYASAEGLGRLGFHDATPHLLAAMASEESWARFPYITALGLIGDERACPALIEMLDDEVLSFPAVVALGQIGDIAALPALAAMVERSGDTAVLQAALTAIAGIEKKTEYFSKVERQAFFHSRAVRILKELPAARLIDVLMGMLTGGAEAETAAALAILKVTAAPVPVERLFPLLDDEGLEEEVRDIIVRQGDAALPAVSAALERNDGANVNQLLRIAGVLGGAEVATVAAPFLGSPETEVVCDALKCLGMAGAGAEFDQMAARLGSPDENIRNAAVGGISHLRKTPQMVQKVLGLLEAEDTLARRGGYRILGFLSSIETLGHLMNGLADPAAAVRAAAAQSLGYVGGSHRAMMERPDCQEALGRLTLDEDPYVRIEGVLAFSRINHPHTHALLLDMLKEHDPAVRSYAIRAVGRCRLREAAPALEALLAREENPEQKIFLCNALAACGSEHALPVLQEQLDDAAPEVVAEAVEAIAAVGGEGAAGVLLPYLYDASWIVQDAVVHAAAGMTDGPAAASIVQFIKRVRESANSGLLLRAAVRTIGRIGGAKEMAAVLDVLGDRVCQYEAFEAAGRIAGRTGMEIDPAGLADPVARRLACTIAGGQPGGATAVAPLLEDSYPSVRRAAALAVAISGLPDAVAAMRERCGADGDHWMREIANLTV